MTDEPQAPEPPQGTWTKIEIPPGHYLKDGQIYWDPASEAYREMVTPKLTDEGPHAS